MKNKPDWRLWMVDDQECKLWLDEYLRKNVLRSETLASEDYLAKAEHNISFSNWLIDKHRDEIPKIFGKNENFYDWAVVSFYYSVYHAALSLISKFHISSKSHFATLCAVIYYYFHKSKYLTIEDIEFLGGYLEKEDIEAFVRTKSLRERASYGVSTSFERILVDEAKKNAEKFVEKVRKIVRE